ncbi:MAG: hypothetical protein WDZ90_01820 [Candidatus Paceibacterota bacterium]
MDKKKKRKILFLITKANFGEAETKGFFENPRFSTLPLDKLGVTALLHGELPFPGPLTRAAKIFL